MQWTLSASVEIGNNWLRFLTGEGEETQVKPTKSMIVHILDLCLEAASVCVEHGNDAPANQVMKSKFSNAARNVSQWNLGGIRKAGLFLRPMERSLVKRFGPLVGRELYWDFVESFWIQSWTDVPLDDSRMERPILHTKEWHWRLMAHRTLKRLLEFETFSIHIHRD
jgi:hypothetical protein